MNRTKILKSIAAICIGVLVYFVYYEYQQIHELKNFRTSADRQKRGLIAERPSTEGLDQLHISGSARPTKEGLRNALSSIDMPVYIFDVFAEKQYYINGMSESWYGYKRSKAIGLDSKNPSLRSKAHRLFYTGKLKHDESDAQTPQAMAEELGFHHIRFDYVRKQIPTDAQVDEFVQQIESLPNPVWVHFHCSAGRGRTTMAMVMYDIMKNGRKVSLNDIVTRHYLMGSENLFDTTVWPNGRYTKKMLEDRVSFITRFYEYINSPDGYGTKSWTEWIQSKT